MTDEFDKVLTQLEALRFTPARSGAAAQSGLQDFLNEAARLRPTVSAQPRRRLTGWMPQLRLRFTSNQERSPMFALAIKLALVLAVMFAGAGVTAATAQSSLPNEVLYPVKLLIEDVQSGLASSPDAQIDVRLEHAQQRVREMMQLTDWGAAIPADVPIRLQTQLQAALQIAAQQDDRSMQAALDRIQLRTQDQLREMDRLHLNEAAQALMQARAMAQLGQSDPQAFRARFGHGRPADAPPQPVMTPEAAPSHTPQGPRASLTLEPPRTPQATCTMQPLMINTPQGQSYGPGPQSTAQSAVTPVGQGAGHEYGPGSQNTPQGSGGSQATPTSGGSGSGSGGSGSGSGGSGSGGGSGNGNGSGSSGSGSGSSGSGGGGSGSGNGSGSGGRSGRP